jgi:PGF-CTERM protein
MNRNITAAVAFVVACSLLASAVFVGPVAADQHEIDSCTVIDEPGEYELAGDIQHDGSETCIEIRGVDATLHGNGHAITGPGPAQSGPGQTAGIAINESGGEMNVTVRNVELAAWDSGVDTDEVSQGTVRFESSTIRGNGVGVSATYATGQTTITDTVIEENGDGFRGASPGAVTITDSIIRNNDRAGFDTSESDDIEMDSTVVRDNGGVGVRVGGRAGSIAFTNVTVTDNEGTGIVAHDSGDLVSVSKTTVTGNGGDGVRLLFDSEVTDSRFENNEGDGLFVGGSSDVEYTTVRGNEGTEFDARDGSASATALVVGDSASADFSDESVALEPVPREDLLPRENGDAAGDGIETSGVEASVDLELAVDTDGDSVDLWRYDGSSWTTEEEDVPVNDGRIEVAVDRDGTYAPGTTQSDDSGADPTPTRTTTPTATASDDDETDPTPTATPTATESGDEATETDSGGGFVGGSGSGSDDTPTETATPTDSPTATSTTEALPAGTTEQNGTGTETADETTETETETEEDAAGDGPGFGPVVALAALLASALLIRRRR